VLRRPLRYTPGVLLWLSVVVEAAPAIAAAFLIVEIVRSGFSRGYSDWVGFLILIVWGGRNVRDIVRDLRERRAQHLRKIGPTNAVSAPISS